MSFTIEMEERKNGRLAHISLLTLPPNNTLSRPLLKELITTLRDAGKDADVILCTSAHPKFFCNGLDGALLVAGSPQERRETILAMIDAALELYRLPKPWIVEIAGHAMAGGAVIAVAADNRYMLSGSGRIGFSELAMGLPLPVCFTRMMHAVVTPSYVRSLLEGMAFKSDEALQMGLIDGVAETAQALRSLSLKRADQILRLDPEAYLPTRQLYRSTILEQMERDLERDRDLASKLIELPVFARAMAAIASRNKS
ncbi:MAG: enoyl-CoA hydratase/isomerase family protein [Spirochaetales bacterium]|nr:enoyl-CoA hydratase/isomerase family protein [Spirochaetales bacterium]